MSAFSIAVALFAMSASSTGGVFAPTFFVAKGSSVERREIESRAVCSDAPTMMRKLPEKAVVDYERVGECLNGRGCQDSTKVWIDTSYLAKNAVEEKILNEKYAVYFPTYWPSRVVIADLESGKLEFPDKSVSAVSILSKENVAAVAYCTEGGCHVGMGEIGYRAHKRLFEVDGVVDSILVCTKDKLYVLTTENEKVVHGPISSILAGVGHPRVKLDVFVYEANILDGNLTVKKRKVGRYGAKPIFENPIR